MLTPATPDSDSAGEFPAAAAPPPPAVALATALLEPLTVDEGSEGETEGEVEGEGDCDGVSDGVIDGVIDGVSEGVVSKGLGVALSVSDVKSWPQLLAGPEQQ